MLAETGSYYSPNEYGKVSTAGLDYEDSDEEMLGDELDDEQQASPDGGRRRLPGGVGGGQTRLSAGFEMQTLQTVGGGNLMSSSSNGSLSNSMMSAQLACLAGQPLLPATPASMEMGSLTGTPPLGVAVAQAIGLPADQPVGAGLMTPIDKLYSMQSSYFSGLPDCDNCH